MKSFMNADFLLPDACSQRLFHEYAAQMQRSARSTEAFRARVGALPFGQRL